MSDGNPGPPPGMPPPSDAIPLPPPPMPPRFNRAKLPLPTDDVPLPPPSDEPLPPPSSPPPSPPPPKPSTPPPPTLASLPPPSPPFRPPELPETPIQEPSPHRATSSRRLPPTPGSTKRVHPSPGIPLPSPPPRKASVVQPPRIPHRPPPSSVLRPKPRVSNEEDDEIAPLPDMAPTPRQMDKIRRNSAIVKQSHTPGPSSPIHSKAPSLKGSSKEGSVGSSVLDLTQDDEDGDDVEDSAEMNIDKVADMLGRMVHDLQRILNSNVLPEDDTTDILMNAKNKLSTIQSALEEGKLGTDDRNDVDALVDFSRHKWNFDKSGLVPWYRATANQRPHESWDFEDWHAPQFFSDFPVPMAAKQVTCVVKLPVGAGTATHTKLFISEQDSVAKALTNALSKCKNLGKESDYVLKGSGLHEYLMRGRKLFEYEYVRMCVREGYQIKLSLVKMPQPLGQDPGSVANRQGYRDKLDPTVQPADPNVYADVSPVPRDWTKIQFIPMSDVMLPFRVQIHGLDGVDRKCIPRLGDYLIANIWLECFVFHGCERLPDSTTLTEVIPLTSSPRWMSWHLNTYMPDLLVNALPREARMGFLMWGKTNEGKDIRLAWVVHQLVDHEGMLSVGKKELVLWPFPKKSRGKHKKRDMGEDFIYRMTVMQNLATHHPCTLTIGFDEFALPVVSPFNEPFTKPNPMKLTDEMPEKNLSSKEKKRLEAIIASDGLYKMTEEDKSLCWLMRHSLVSHPQVLPKFLLSCKWGNPDQRMEARRLMEVWAKPSSLVEVLLLLDGKFQNTHVRKYAVEQLRNMPDYDLQLYLLQLTQCLKFEPYHDSPLSNFLLERAIRSPSSIGHHFFWHLKAELHEANHAERFGLILEEYLSNCGRHAAELRKQVNAVYRLQRVAAMIVRLKREEGYGDREVMKEYTNELVKLNRIFFAPMGKFQIPLDPKIEATTLIVEKCRYMSSKMVPLWLVFRNADEDADPIFIMFKSGDDLRQDILTLQLLRVMDKLWLENGLDMKMKPYRCIATGVNEHGDGVGMIEIVLNSDTTSGIQLKYGGGAMGALMNEPIDMFLHDHNKGTMYTEAVNNFIASCAGYCVATYVMGIGDRHNGNIMVTKDGHLFHIDFGHFLGNFKKKFGVNRERAAFVFTPEMAYVMGGKKYRRSDKFTTFRSLCFSAFRVLRKNATMLEALFLLMAAAGMPELMMEDDILYMRDKFSLALTDKKADKKLEEEIKKSLDSTYRRIDNMIHNFVHK